MNSAQQQFREEIGKVLGPLLEVPPATISGVVERRTLVGHVAWSHADAYGGAEVVCPALAAESTIEPRLCKYCQAFQKPIVGGRCSYCLLTVDIWEAEAVEELVSGTGGIAPSELRITNTVSLAWKVLVSALTHPLTLTGVDLKTGKIVRVDKRRSTAA